MARCYRRTRGSWAVWRVVACWVVVVASVVVATKSPASASGDSEANADAHKPQSTISASGGRSASAGLSEVVSSDGKDTSEITPPGTSAVRDDMETPVVERFEPSESPSTIAPESSEPQASVSPTPVSPPESPIEPSTPVVTPAGVVDEPSVSAASPSETQAPIDAAASEPPGLSEAPTGSSLDEVVVHAAVTDVSSTPPPIGTEALEAVDPVEDAGDDSPAPATPAPPTTTPATTDPAEWIAPARSDGSTASSASPETLATPSPATPTPATPVPAPVFLVTPSPATPSPVMSSPTAPSDPAETTTPNEPNGPTDSPPFPASPATPTPASPSSATLSETTAPAHDSPNPTATSDETSTTTLSATPVPDLSQSPSTNVLPGEPPVAEHVTSGESTPLTEDPIASFEPISDVPNTELQDSQSPSSVPADIDEHHGGGLSDDQGVPLRPETPVTGTPAEVPVALGTANTAQPADTKPTPVQPEEPPVLTPAAETLLVGVQPVFGESAEPSLPESIDTDESSEVEESGVAEQVETHSRSVRGPTTDSVPVDHPEESPSSSSAVVLPASDDAESPVILTENPPVTSLPVAPSSAEPTESGEFLDPSATSPSDTPSLSLPEEIRDAMTPAGSFEPLHSAMRLVGTTGVDSSAHSTSLPEAVVDTPGKSTSVANNFMADTSITSAPADQGLHTLSSKPPATTPTVATVNAEPSGVFVGKNTSPPSASEAARQGTSPVLDAQTTATLKSGDLVDPVTSSTPEVVTSATQVADTDAHGEKNASSPLLEGRSSDEHLKSMTQEAKTIEAKQLKFSQTNELIASKDDSKPVVVDLNPANAEEPEVYVRGQTSILEAQLITGSKASADGGSATADKDHPVVMGGRRRGAFDGVASTESAARFYESIRYSTSLACGMSIALFVLFHFAFFDPRLTWTHGHWSPNSWECILYIQYIQQTMSLSALTLLKTPYFLWEFTDTFSWTNFLVQGDVSGSTTDSRRLKTIVLDGLVGYSDRIGIDETKILYQCVVGFAVTLGILLLALFAVSLFAKWKRGRIAANASSSNQLLGLQSIAVRILGLCVLVWYFSLFPLSLTSSFEASMEIQANMLETWPLFFSWVALVGVCSVGLAVGARSVLQKTEKELRNFETVAVWGVLYADCKHRARMFFMFGASIQIAMGMCIGVLGSSPTLLVLLVAMQLLYLFAAFQIEPFAHRFVLLATCAVSVLKLTNLGFAFAFLQSNELSSESRIRVANAYLGINVVVIYLWFIRLLVVFCSCVTAWSDRKLGPRARHRESPPTATHAGMIYQLTASSKKDPSVGGAAEASSIADEVREEIGYTTSISPAESTPTLNMLVSNATHSKQWSQTPWETKV